MNRKGLNLIPSTKRVFDLMRCDFPIVQRRHTNPRLQFRWHDHQTYRTPKGIVQPFSAAIDGAGDLLIVQKMSQSDQNETPSDLGRQNELTEGNSTTLAKLHPVRPHPSGSNNFRNEFRRYENVSRKDFSTIEYLLRRGRRTLETYSQPGIRDIHS